MHTRCKYWYWRKDGNLNSDQDVERDDSRMLHVLLKRYVCISCLTSFYIFLLSAGIDIRASETITEAAHVERTRISEEYKHAEHSAEVKHEANELYRYLRS